MSLSMHLAVLGPIDNNVYFLVDNDSKDCVLMTRALSRLSNCAWRKNRVGN